MDHLQNIRSLLEKSGYDKHAEIIPMPVSGSSRKYFRVLLSKNNSESVLASFNNDISENIAWNSFTQHFRSIGLRVPEILNRDESYKYFLIQDLGNTTLFDILASDRNKAEKLLFEVVNNLLDFQIDGINNLDLDVAYPVKEFSRRSIMWDLNYFKYYFVKPHNIDFNEDRLESDFENFTNILLGANCKYFNYRDFQSRNIMYFNDELWYIDYQGGRKGPLQYDLVSLLNQVKAGYSSELKKQLYDHYISNLKNRLPDEIENFEKYYHDYEYFRLMQVMGAYGFRGKVQRKGHFLQSIAPSISALKNLMDKMPFHNQLKELANVLEQITIITDYSESNITDGLTITVNSFSYKKKGIPVDTTGNGGGHVFDCRSLPNPGRYDGLRDYTGIDKPIIDFLSEKQEIKEFISSVKLIIDQSVKNYLERSFNQLQINFGCTGGRHRSVYSATTIGRYLADKYPEVNIVVNHNELE